jgi:hypothetical protein
MGAFNNTGFDGGNLHRPTMRAARCSTAASAMPAPATSHAPHCTLSVGAPRPRRDHAAASSAALDAE